MKYRDQSEKWLPHVVTERANIELMFNDPYGDVSTMQIASLAESAHTTMPVEPVWPKIFSEQPALPAPWPTLSPKPHTC